MTTAVTDGARTTAVVVDDEPLALDSLADALEHGGNLRVLARCRDGYAALDAVRALRPDVLFLDIEMPELDGFAVLERLEPEDVPPAVVFVTAYDAHTLRAFAARALDYVLKPVAPERLAEAVSRAEHRTREARALRAALERDASPAAEPHGGGYLDRIVIRDVKGTTVVGVPEIERLEAETYYVRLHTLGEHGARLLVRERMHVLEARLDPKQFVRTHRSVIVRIDQIREMRSLSRYESLVVLASGARAPVSRERRPKVAAILRALGAGEWF